MPRARCRGTGLSAGRGEQAYGPTPPTVPAAELPAHLAGSSVSETDTSEVATTSTEILFFWNTSNTCKGGRRGPEQGAAGRHRGRAGFMRRGCTRGASLSGMLARAARAHCLLASHLG